MDVAMAMIYLNLLTDKYYYDDFGFMYVSSDLYWYTGKDWSGKSRGGKKRLEVEQLTMVGEMLEQLELKG